LKGLKVTWLGWGKGWGVYPQRGVSFVRGEFVASYVGEVVTFKEMEEREERLPASDTSTYAFEVEPGEGNREPFIIDSRRAGNVSRLFNHRCSEPTLMVRKIYRGSETGLAFFAAKDFADDEELTFNYGLVSDEPMTDELKVKYACRCGAKKCKGTMLA
jgi:SET domain-containing protein